MLCTLSRTTTVTLAAIASSNTISNVRPARVSDSKITTKSLRRQPLGGRPNGAASAGGGLVSSKARSAEYWALIRLSHQAVSLPGRTARLAYPAGIEVAARLPRPVQCRIAGANQIQSLAI